jgi:hypothetical protein
MSQCSITFGFLQSNLLGRQRDENGWIGRISLCLNLVYG